MWTDNEVEILRNEYPIYGSKYCKQILNKSVRVIKKKANELNLDTPKYNITNIKYTIYSLTEATENSNNYSETLNKLNIKNAGGNIETLKKYIAIYNIDITHFIDPTSTYLVNFTKKRKELSHVLVDNSTYSRSSLKERLYKEGLKERKCELCGQGEECMGKKMSLIIDHINGSSNDNRIDNLRIVCPNCNSTLDTHYRKTRSD